ncbi:MAG: glycosyltransferase family 4 protein, partial [Bacteroidota bacterium]
YINAMMGLRKVDVLKKEKQFSVKNIRLNTNESFDKLGRFTVKKTVDVFRLLAELSYQLIFFRPNLIYIMPATKGFAFVRDFMVQFISSLFCSRIVFHLRTQITSEDIVNRYKFYFLKSMFNEKNVILLGNKLRNDFLKYFHPEHAFVLANTIHNSLTDNEFKNIVAPKGSKTSLNILYLSNMMKAKGWFETLMTAEVLMRKGVEFNLRFAGSWQSKVDKNEFFSYIEKNNLKNHVFYEGVVGGDKKRSLLHHSDILVFPTTYVYEALPRVIIEAFEYGVVPISTYNGSVPDLIEHGCNGYLIKNTNPETISNYITKLVDREVLINISKNAREAFLEKYQISVFKSNFINIIKRLF